MGEEKLLLTEAIAWKDLMALKGSQKSPGVIILLIAVWFFFVLLAFFAVFMLGKNLVGWQPVLVLALAFGLLSGILYRRYRAAIKKTVLEPMDVEAMIFDTDVCIHKCEKPDGDNGYNYSLVFDKAGLIEGADVPRIPGIPVYHNISVGDRFFTVSLRDNPKIVKYYSCQIWWLGDPQKDEK